MARGQACCGMLHFLSRLRLIKLRRDIPQQKVIESSSHMSRLLLFETKTTQSIAS